MDPKEQEKIQEEILNADSDATVKAEEQPQTPAEETSSDNTTENGETATEESNQQQDELAEVKAQINEMKDKYLRLSAEFDNYRKRTLKEKAELILNGSEKCIVSILPVVDDMERAFKNMKPDADVDAIREGMELIYNKFVKILEQNGVKAIDTAEKPLDTDFHEAIAIIPAPTEELKGKILDCTLKGYTLNEKVIRHAQVVVGQ